LQPDLVLVFVNDPSLSTPVAMFKGVWSAMATGFAIETGYQGLDSLSGVSVVIGWDRPSMRRRSEEVDRDRYTSSVDRRFGKTTT
jgi:hypothetical protein